MTPERSMVHRLEQYYDAVPRRRARTERVGPFTLFVADAGWPYYARPALGGSEEIRTSDVRRVLDRQRELDVPRSIEWVDEVTPGLAATVETAGVRVARCPLLVLVGAPKGSPGTVLMLSPDEVDALVATRAAISVSFAYGGNATADAGIEARDAELKSARKEVDARFLTDLRSGASRMAAAFAPGVGQGELAPTGGGRYSSDGAAELGPVGGGSYSPVGNVAEIAGVGVLPAYRRRGLAAQLSYVLATDALTRGVTTVFCSAESDDVARVYQAVGFCRVGTACIAEAT
ncbi:MAG: GNAT family N-acetyltransferase [Nocardioidaceae bacterium]|nr:GNAT family N-acetyltransferase [Nocardioidaceae bacterium]